MIKKTVFALLLFLFINSCGYNPIYINKENNFSLTSISTEDKKRVTYKIKNRLSKYVGLQNKMFSFKILLGSNEKIRTTSKDEKGNPKTFEIRISVNLLVEENDVTLKKEFVEIFTYQNKSNKFDLKKYKNEISDNLIEKIILDIDDYLNYLTE